MTKENSKKLLADAKMSLMKTFGKGIAGSYEEAKLIAEEPDSSGSIGIDLCLNGGYPKGKITEIYGPESCLDENSFIPYEVWSGDDTKRLNHKGGSIRRLYERFNNVDDGLTSKGRHLQRKQDVSFYVKSVNYEGYIVKNKVVDVVKTGYKPCLNVKTKSGLEIIATKDHKFMTPNGFKPLSDIKPGDEVMVHNSTRLTGSRSTRKYYKEIYVKYHPYWRSRLIDGKYKYYRSSMGRAAYEAHLNNMDVKQYKNFLDTKSRSEINTLKFVSSDLHIHHIDENINNNDISNLMLIDPSMHGKIHSKDRKKNLSFVAVEDVIVSIEDVGQRLTYDIKCEFPNNNFIAKSPSTSSRNESHGGFVVHNSGKTTSALHAVADCQKKGGTALFVDLEGSFDPVYAEALGVDVYNEDKFIYSSPDTGEQALEITEKFLRTGQIGIAVIDSVATLLPEKEEGGDYGDAQMGSQARLMSQGCRKLLPVVKKHGVTFIFINQLRSKIGGYGNPEVTSGGNALKFYAAVRVDIRKDGSPIKDKEGNVIGEPRRAKIIKSKISKYQNTVVKFDIYYGKGIDQYGEIIDMGVEAGIIQKSGSWYAYMDTKIAQGREAAKLFMQDNPEIFEELKEKVLG